MRVVPLPTVRQMQAATLVPTKLEYRSLEYLRMRGLSRGRPIPSVCMRDAAATAPRVRRRRQGDMAVRRVRCTE